VQTVALVGVFRAAGARVNTVLSLEIGRELVDVDRLYVASDGVFHLDSVTRVLKSNPLYTVLVLSYNEGCCCRNGTRRSVGVDTRTTRRTLLVHVWCADRRSLGLLLRWAKT
jgi:hypothetical protein